MGNCCGKPSNEVLVPTKVSSGKSTLILSSPKNADSPIFNKVPYTHSSTLTEYNKNKSSIVERKRLIDAELMKKYPIGYGWKENVYQYTMWVPETPTTMQHFIEVHGIPIYDFQGEKDFKDYCQAYKWENTFDKYFEMWCSMLLITTRFIQSTIIRYNISFDISDCFLSNQGIITRAYVIYGFHKNSVLKACSFITNSLNPQIGRGVMWHHDTLFSKDIYPEDIKTNDEYDNFQKDCCGYRSHRLEYAILSKSFTNNSCRRQVSERFSTKNVFKNNKQQQQQQNNNNYQLEKSFLKLYKINIKKKPLLYENNFFNAKIFSFIDDYVKIIYFRNDIDEDVKVKLKTILQKSLDIKRIIDNNSKHKDLRKNSKIDEIEKCIQSLSRLKFGCVDLENEQLIKLDLLLIALPNLEKVDEKLNQLICVHHCSGSVIKKCKKGVEIISYIAIRGYKGDIEKLREALKNLLVLNYSLDEKISSFVNLKIY